MSYKRETSTKILIKRISYLLGEINLSIELLQGVSTRKIYRLLKKASKVSTKLKLSKTELKNLSLAFSNQNSEALIIPLVKKYRLFNNLTLKYNSYQKIIIDYTVLLFWPLINLFWDLKQIIRC